jgi:hypothetical protein
MKRCLCVLALGFACVGSALAANLSFENRSDVSIPSEIKDEQDGQIVVVNELVAKRTAELALKK